MVQYLHFRILEFPLIYRSVSTDVSSLNLSAFRSRRTLKHLDLSLISVRVKLFFLVAQFWGSPWPRVALSPVFTMLSKDPQLEHFLRKGFLLKLEPNFDKITHLLHRSFLLMINNYRKYWKTHGDIINFMSSIIIDYHYFIINISWWLTIILF